MKALLLALLFLCLSAMAQTGSTIVGSGSSGGVPIDTRNYTLSAFTLKTSFVNPTLPLSTPLGVSGVTYNARSGTLFVVRNETGLPGQTFEMTTDGVQLRAITHSNFIDTEAICWVGWDATTSADIFLIVEEDHTTAANESQISLVKLTPAATTLNRSAAGNVTATTGYSGGTIANLGVEGVAYDSGRGMIYYTAEKRTGASQNAPGSTNAKIYQRPVVVTGTMSFGAETQLCDIAALYGAPTSLIDIADLCYDRVTDTIILITQETTKRAIRISRAGAVQDMLTITPATAAGPEGVAIHPSGTELYVVGEESEYFRYAMGWHSPSSRTGVRRTIYVNAGAMVPRTTAGAIPGTVEMATNRIMVDSMDFADGTERAAGFWLTLPRAWDLGTVTAVFQWTSTAASGSVKWDIAARCIATNTAIDNPLGTEQSATTSAVAANAATTTSATPALTIGGTLTYGAPVYWQITRDIAGDTLAVDAKLMGVTIEYKESATEPPAQ